MLTERESSALRSQCFFPFSGTRVGAANSLPCTRVAGGLDCFLTGEGVCKGHSLLGFQTSASSCGYPIDGVQVCSLTLGASVMLHAKTQA